MPYRVVAVHPHDPAAYTQGLVWDDAVLLESTGRYGSSRLREVELATGAVRRERALDPGLFGEGLARVGDRLVQLTWREGVAIVWDRASFREVARLPYAGEGWGLAWDGTDLWMSNGSSTLVRRDPATFAERGRVRVTLAGQPLPNLNELEAVGGKLWANVYTTDRLVRIDPATGAVDAMLDLSGLLEPQARAEAEVLNGIAWRAVPGEPGGGRLLVTGKLWPKLFELALDPPPGG